MGLVTFAWFAGGGFGARLVGGDDQAVWILVADLSLSDQHIKVFCSTIWARIWWMR